MSHLISLILLLVCLVLLCILWMWLQDKKAPSEQEVDLAKIESRLTGIQARIEQIPNKTVHSIRGANNEMQGITGELVSYIELHKTHDRVILMGDIVDMLAIRWPSVGDPGQITFVEIKSGKARLSSRQRDVKKMIEDGNVNFQILRTIVK